jgi:hypothetical protein
MAVEHCWLGAGKATPHCCKHSHTLALFCVLPFSSSCIVHCKPNTIKVGAFSAVHACSCSSCYFRLKTSLCQHSWPIHPTLGTIDALNLPKMAAVTKVDAQGLTDVLLGLYRRQLFHTWPLSACNHKSL